MYHLNEMKNEWMYVVCRVGLLYTKEVLWSIDVIQSILTQKSWNWNLNKTFSGILYVLTHNKQASSFYALQAIDVAAEHFQKTLERLVWEKK